MNLTPEIIIKEVAKYFGLTVEQVLAKGRDPKCVTARYVMMYFMKMLAKMRLKVIGSYFNGDKSCAKNHATVLHGIKRINNDMDVSKEMREDIRILKSKFKLKEAENGPEVDDYFGVFGWYDYFPLPEKYKKPEIDFSTPFKSPFADRESCVNRAYSGYKAVV